jgi:hypothetical protein
MRFWESLGGGMARARVFDVASEGPQYLLKSLEGGDLHESAKFGKRSDLIASRSLVKMVAKGLHCNSDASGLGNRLSTTGQD